MTSKQQLDRRRFLLGTAGATLFLAGCSSGTDDADGDGVPDDEDYAPQDPAVQEKSDVGEQTERQTTQSTTTALDADVNDVNDDGESLRAEAERKMTRRGGATSADYRLVVTESEFYQEGYTEGVRGVVENISETDFDYVQIEIGFYDESGAKVADGLDNTSGLAANSRWRFDAMFLGSNPEDLGSFRVTELSGTSY